MELKKTKFEQYTFGILIALELLMSFTFLGYIHIPPISITTAYIPIVIAACLLGPVESTVVGLIFGLGSMYKASALYVMPADKIFSPFQSSNPFGSLMLSVGSRVLFGLVIGLAFEIVRNKKYERFWNMILAFAASSIHSLLVYAAMGLFFPELGYDYTAVMTRRKGSLFMALVCLVIVEAIYMFYNSKLLKKIADDVNESELNPYSSMKINRILIIVGIFTICMACFSTLYFAQRAGYMLQEYGVDVTSNIEQDLLHLQIQFLVAMLALDFLLLLLVLIVYKYMAYKEYKGELDALTGVMGRRLFLQHCTKLQIEKRKLDQETGWFLFLDVDHFKQINDTYGHTEGDEVLKEIAGILQRTIAEYGEVGRVGGDEFAVIIEKEMSREELEKLLSKFLADVAGISTRQKTSCSIGAYHFMYPQEIQDLLRETDLVLYEAKEKGRACFVVKEEVSW